MENDDPLLGPPPLSIEAEFADAAIHVVYTVGPWAIWYHPDFFSAEQAVETGDLLQIARGRATAEYGMPDAPTKGRFINVYLHDPEGDDGLPDGWSNGVGTNIFDQPYITFPNGAGQDVRNVAHEGFHIFQYSANAPGFEYDGDSQWYIETTAEWFSIEALPGDESIYATAGAIAGQPHLSIWHSFNNGRPEDPIHWMLEARQYGMHLFVEYLVQTTPLTGDDVVEGFFSGTTLLPQEVLAQKIGRDVMADAWADMAGWLVASFAGAGQGPMPDWLMTEAQRDYAVRERGLLVEDDPVPGIEADLAGEVDASAGFDGLLRAPDAQMTRAWSYNAYDIGGVSGVVTASVVAQSPGDFEMRLVTLTDDVWQVDALGQNGTHLAGSTDAAFVVVAATPDRFSGAQDMPYALDLAVAEAAVSGDAVTGTAGNDVLIGDRSSNAIDGGAGADLVIATGGYASARLSADMTLSDAGGLDQLTDVEAIGFDDGVLLLDTDEVATGFLYRLYDAALGRAPDAPGFTFWFNALANGTSRLEATELFLQSAEFLAQGGSLPDSAFLALMYQETLDRAPDPAGEAFWLDALAAGVARADVFLGFSESAEHIAATQTGLGAGVFLAGMTGADLIWG